MHDMCGRVIQDQLGLKIIDALDPRDNRVTGDPFGNVPPRSRVEAGPARVKARRQARKEKGLGRYAGLENRPPFSSLIRVKQKAPSAVPGN